MIHLDCAVTGNGKSASADHTASPCKLPYNDKHLIIIIDYNRYLIQRKPKI